MSKKLFEAKKAVEKKFTADTAGKSAAVKFYYYYDGEVLESESEPVHDTPGFKFRCSWQKGQLNIVNLD
jgi:hypothetical protein